MQLGCETASLPFRYLGIPLHHCKLLNKEWKGIDDWFEKSLDVEKEAHFQRGCLMLINVIVTSPPLFMLSSFEIPKGVRKILN